MNQLFDTTLKTAFSSPNYNTWLCILHKSQVKLPNCLQIIDRNDWMMK